VEKISYGIMENFDYVALGHIHSPQQVGASHIRYSGSPLKYSLSEVNNDKSVPIITLGQKGDTNIELVPLRPLRDMRHIKGKSKHLLDEKNITDPEDFIYATLTDEDTVNDAMGIFQQYYPNTVRIDYDNAHTREISKMDNVISAENKPFEELADLNNWGYFDSGEACTTKTPGIFVAGDCRSKYIRQLTTACADGAVAALAACRYINEL
jgi:exonuclease SbcD